MSGHTPGPWQVWDGPQYVGGGADLCIGAGEKWLANMDHRQCVNRDAHITHMIGECRPADDTDIATTDGCRCGASDCAIALHISEEQLANARLIAAAPTVTAAAEEREAAKDAREEHENTCAFCVQLGPGRGCNSDVWDREERASVALRAAIRLAKEGR